MRPLALASAAIVLLYAIELSEPPFERAALAPRVSVVVPTSPAAPPSQVRRESRRRWQGYALSSLDREGFLARFSQAAGEELVPCLRGEFGAMGKVSFLARLSNKGRLSAVRLIEPLKAAPSCVNTSIRAMTFEDLGARLTDDSVEIQWQFAW